jgi:hypothetical protein
MGFMSGLKDKMSQVVKKASTLLADEEVQRTRISICNSCEFLTMTRNCKKCGCFVDAKSRLAEQHCPIRKW